jgi:hypothetical protein
VIVLSQTAGKEGKFQCHNDLEFKDIPHISNMKSNRRQSTDSDMIQKLNPQSLEQLGPVQKMISGFPLHRELSIQTLLVPGSGTGSGQHSPLNIEGEHFYGFL